VSGFGVVRTLILAFGVLLALGGFAGIAAGGGSFAAAGLWSVITGLILIAAVLLERTRYRADTKDGADLAGPAGGEVPGAALDPRFRPTDERFEDPTTRQKMRVWLDPRSGERRYVPED
jgi:hypothetical protein